MPPHFIILIPVIYLMIFPFCIYRYLPMKTYYSLLFTPLTFLHLLSTYSLLWYPYSYSIPPLFYYAPYFLHSIIIFSSFLFKIPVLAAAPDIPPPHYFLISISLYLSRNFPKIYISFIYIKHSVATYHLCPALLLFHYYCTRPMLFPRYFWISQYLSFL